MTPGRRNKSLRRKLEALISVKRAMLKATRVVALGAATYPPIFAHY